MAIDQLLKGKRGRPACPKSAESKMEQKMALVKQRLALLDSGSSYSESDKDDDFVPMDEELAIVVGQQHIVIDCDGTDYEEEVFPLKIVRPRGVESVQIKLPGVPQTQIAQSASTGLTKTAKVSDVNGQKTCASVQKNCGSAMTIAKEIQAKLPAEHPSFVKYMLQSHVVRGFWLGLPSGFCNKHLPKHDTVIVLEDEDGHNYDTTYLSTKQGLSAGWRGFSIKHGIKVGDVVVFQLVTSSKFKVYIVKANNFTITDGALSLLSLEACKKRKISKESSDDCKPKDDLEVIIVSSKVVQDDGINVVSEAIDGIIFSDSDIAFDDVTSFSNFRMVVDSLVIDCKFPDQLRKTYYELCCAQKSFLHKNLLKQLNLTLVVGVIMETINIAEGIRACKAHASREDFMVWKKTLESFELLGMNVAFLLKRINDLLGLPAQSKDPAECDEYKEIKLEQARAREKIKALESKMSNLKDALDKMDIEMDEMESSVKRSDQALQQMATAPW